MQSIYRWPISILSCLFIIFLIAPAVRADEEKEEKKTDFPAVSKVTEDYTEVQVQDGTTPFFRLWYLGW